MTARTFLILPLLFETDLPRQVSFLLAPHCNYFTPAPGLLPSFERARTDNKRLRRGVLTTGSQAQIRAEVEDTLRHAPEGLFLGADCTVPSETPWKNLRTAIETAHAWQRGTDPASR
jgi:hypothetical protein